MAPCFMAKIKSKSEERSSLTTWTSSRKFTTRGGKNVYKTSCSMRTTRLSFARKRSAWLSRDSRRPLKTR